MCYYNQYNSGKQKVKFASQEVEINEYHLNKSGFEYTSWPIIKNEQSQFKVINAHWEFIAPWLKTGNEILQSRKKYATLNATAEKLFDSKLFANAKPCLVLSTGFIEWKHEAMNGSKKILKQPYFIKVKEHDYFFMAGILGEWLDVESGEIIPNFAIITTQANSLMEQIHNTKKRMPTILPIDLAEQWLQETNLDKRKALANYAIPSACLQAQTIDKSLTTNTLF